MTQGHKLRVLDLFSGIGGFSLGLERTGGFETVAFCEIEPYAQKVLKKHWPDVPIFEDVRKLDGKELEAKHGRIDVITGGFPCQDISVAGKQAGIGDGTRSGLWSEIARLISEIRPDHAIVENVTNLLAGPSEQPGGWFCRILGDLAEIGYDAEWHCIPASYVGAPHRRDRVWVVAHPQKLFIDECEVNGKHSGLQQPKSGNGRSQANVAHHWGQRIQGIIQKTLQGEHAFSWCQNIGRIEELRNRPNLPEPLVCRNNDGVSQRLHACGNSVVPQIVEMIGNAILEARET